MSDLSSAEILRLTREYGLYEWAAQKAVKPLSVDHAQGVYFWTVDGKRFLDFNSQLMCVNIGHGDERVLTAIREQSEKLTYVMPHLVTEPRARLHQLLAEVSPGTLKRSFLTLSGAEANEHAVRIARLATRRQKILVRYRSYHGATAGAVSLTGEPRRWGTEPGIPGVVRAMDPYRYRCRWCQEQSACNLDCLNHVEDVIQFEGAHTIAAVLIETVTGTNGIIIPPDGYLQGLRTLCDKHGILLIADEVMSGFGRTGEWFAVDHWDVVPDIMTVAKGLTSAYLPLGAIMVNDEIAAHFEDNFLYSGLTYGAHPVSCAAAVATIKVYQEDGLIEHAKKMGAVLAHEMERLRNKHPSVGETRSIGLFGLFELVKNRQTREPLAPFNATPAEMGPMAQLGAFFRENGLFTLVRWNTFFVNPPLCISEEQLREGLAIIDQALDITDAAVSA